MAGLDELGATSQTGVRRRQRDLPGQRRSERIIGCIKDSVVIEKILTGLDMIVALLVDRAELGETEQET